MIKPNWSSNVSLFQATKYSKISNSSSQYLAHRNVVVVVVVVVGVGVGVGAVGVAVVPLAAMTGSSFPFLVALVVPFLVAPVMRMIAILIY